MVTNADKSRGEFKTQILLLTALATVLLLQPFVEGWGLAGGIAMQISFLLVLVFGANVGQPSRWLVVVIRFTAGAAFVAGNVVQFYPATWLGLITPILYIAVFGLVTGRLLAFVLGGGVVNSSKLCGAISAYATIGVAWGLVYLVVELAASGSFSAPGAEELEAPDFVYFSLVTLSTLGYGDIAPVSRIARSLATFEAMFGQMYLAILVARLVGLSAVRQESGK